MRLAPDDTLSEFRRDFESWLDEHPQEGPVLGDHRAVPLPPGDPMFSLENVLLSPHCADHTADWLNEAMQFFLDQYRRFSNGEALENVVDKSLGY